MTEILAIVFTFVFLVVEIFNCFLYSVCVDRILNREGHWLLSLVTSLGITVLLALFYTWMPIGMGLQVSLLEDTITLEGGMFYQNLGMVLAVQAFTIGIAICKHLWSAIRRKEKFSFSFVMLEAVFLAAFAVAGAQLIKDTRMISFDPGSNATYIIGFVIAAAILGLMTKAALTGNRKSRNQNNARP